MARHDSRTLPLYSYPAVLLILVGTLVMLPALFGGAMGAGFDSVFHRQWLEQFATQFWNGDLYPRWMMDLNDGFGSPAFFIYPPLSQVPATLLYPLLGGPARLDFLLGMSAWLAIVASGLTCLFWMRRLMPNDRVAALVGAMVYMLAPYHLYVDVYQRGALAEVWAFVWPPVALSILHGMGRLEPGKTALLSMSVAALILTHAPSVMVVTPALLIYAVLLDHAEDGHGRALGLAAACALGAMLAGIYLGTALTHTAFIDTAALFEGRFSSPDWLLGGGRWVDPAIERDIYISTALQGIIGMVAVISLWSRRRAGDMAVPLAALVFIVLSLFLMSVLSKPLWDLGTPLNRIQFPWRFSLLLSLGTAMAIALHTASQGAGGRQALYVPTIFLLVSLMLYLFPASHPAEPGGGKWDAPEYQLASKESVADIFRPGERARLTFGRGHVKIDRWRPRHIQIDVTVDSAAVLAVRQFRYSGWALASDSNGTIKMRKDQPYLQVEMSPGQHRIVLSLEETVGERLGRLVSLAALGVLALLALIAIRRRVSLRSAALPTPA